MKKLVFGILLLLVAACNTTEPATHDKLPIGERPSQAGSASPVVPRENRWGIYRLDLLTQAIELVYSSPTEIAGLRLSENGECFVFSQRGEGGSESTEEIYSLGVDGSDLRRITTNDLWDLYPVWSPDGSRVAFLSSRGSGLGIYVMNADGGGERILLDSSAHEADIDWVGDQIAFTRDSSIWVAKSDGTGARQLTSPPRAGEWGNANLPFGDYDPRISPDGSKIVFERLVGDESEHGNYDLFIVDTAGAGEVQLTHSGYSQGLASWSRSGKQIAYIIAAIGQAAAYDLYMTSADGAETRDVTPPYFPSDFLCRSVVFSRDDTVIYFVGEWWAHD
ncbi:MAG: PD40 domain-containing protein [Anaerolineae bacterium]|nr:PD40 domain-containing protein [Anaerolineae bacterium]